MSNSKYQKSVSSLLKYKGNQLSKKQPRLCAKHNPLTLTRTKVDNKNTINIRKSYKLNRKLLKKTNKKLQYNRCKTINKRQYGGKISCSEIPKEYVNVTVSPEVDDVIFSKIINAKLSLTNTDKIDIFQCVNILRGKNGLKLFNPKDVILHNRMDIKRYDNSKIYSVLHYININTIEDLIKLKGNNHVKRITFGNHFDQHIDVGILPPNLTDLTFGNNFNQHIDKDVLPQSLKHLRFGYNFTHLDNPIYVGVLPPKLTNLHLGNKFNQRIDKDVLPLSLIKLVFGNEFNQRIDKDVLPLSLIKLVFGNEFNEHIDTDVLPKSLTHLTFGMSFNEHIDKGVLPDSITHLTFGYDFNKPVDNLPDSITHLTFGDDFNELVNKLPNSITHLTFGNRFNQKIDILPDAITHLIFGNRFNQKIDILPDAITHLIFGKHFNQLIDKDVLPQSLTHLTINHNHLLDILPPDDDNGEYYNTDKLPFDLHYI